MELRDRDEKEKVLESGSWRGRAEPSIPNNHAEH